MLREQYVSLYCFSCLSFRSHLPLSDVRYWFDFKTDLSSAVGITHHTQRGHIARATLEAVCFQTKAILDAMKLDSGQKLYDIAVDGGMSNSEVCMQVGTPVDNPVFYLPTLVEYF